jgi:hypothetical protein
MMVKNRTVDFTFPLVVKEAQFSVIQHWEVFMPVAKLAAPTRVSPASAAEHKQD